MLSSICLIKMLKLTLNWIFKDINNNLGTISIHSFCLSTAITKSSALSKYCSVKNWNESFSPITKSRTKTCQPHSLWLSLSWQNRTVSAVKMATCMNVLFMFLLPRMGAEGGRERAVCSSCPSPGGLSAARWLQQPFHPQIVLWVLLCMLNKACHPPQPHHPASFHQQIALWHQQKV